MDFGQAFVWCAGAGVAALGTLAVRWPYRRLPLDRDYGLWGYFAQRWLDEGYLPQHWAHSDMAPGRIYVYALGLKLVGKTPLRFQLFVSVCHALAAVLAFAVGARLGGVAGGLAAGLAYALFSNLPSLMAHYSNSESLQNIPALICALLLAGAAAPAGPARTLAAGAACGCAVLFKQTAMPNLALPAAIFILLRSPDVLLSLVCFAAGGAAALAVAAVAHIATRTPFQWFFVAPRMIYTILRYLADGVYDHASSGKEESVREAKRQALLVIGRDLLPLAVLAAGGLVMLRGGASAPPLLTFAALWAGCAMLTVIASREYIPYHFVSLVAPLALLAGSGYGHLHDLAAWQAAPQTATAAVAFWLAALLVILANMRYWKRGGWQVLAAEGDLQLADFGRQIGTYLAERTAVDDFVYVWGSEPEVYLFAERRCPCDRVICPYISFQHNERDDTTVGRENFAGIMQALQRHPPAYVAIMWPVLDYEEFLQFLNGRYAVETKLADRFPILRRVDAVA